MTLSFSFRSRNLLLLQLELHLDAELGFTLLGFALGILIIVLGLDLGLEFRHLLLELSPHSASLSLLSGLLLLHLDTELLHLGGILSLKPRLLFSLRCLVLSILQSLLLGHGELVGDWACGVVAKLNLAVSSLASIQEDCAGSENDSVVRLELNWVCTGQLDSVDVAMSGCLSTVRNQVRSVAFGLENRVISLDADATQADLWLVLTIRLLSAHFGSHVL